MIAPFTKMHGLGNDFVIFNTLDMSINLDDDAKTSLILREIADRHLGIGCDQILFLTPAKTTDSNFHCRIFNADGSEAGMSGNGLRCLAKFVYSKSLIAERSFVISTYARNVEVYIENDNLITLNMGNVDFAPENIPILATPKAFSYNLETSFGKFDFGAVSLGNPHAVIKIDDLDTIDVEKIGGLISKHPIFPQQANVSFMQVLNNSNIKLRTYERGTGVTLACGSGSCAAVAIGKIWKLLDEVVTVHLRHGNLQVKWKNIDSPLFLTGPASEVFDGAINLG